MRIRLESRAIAVLYLCFCHDAHSCFLMLDIVLISVSPPQKYHPLFIQSLSPLNLQTVQAPLVTNSPSPLYWFCVPPCNLNPPYKIESPYFENLLGGSATPSPSPTARTGVEWGEVYTC